MEKFTMQDQQNLIDELRIIVTENSLLNVVRALSQVCADHSNFTKHLYMPNKEQLLRAKLYIKAMNALDKSTGKIDKEL